MLNHVLRGCVFIPLISLLIMPLSVQADAYEPVLTFAVVGDAEPKPEAAFPGLAATVDTLNAMAQSRKIEWVFGVGDLPHKATDIQYENLTAVLQNLRLPFYPLMGNEEFHGSPEKFLRFAQSWGNATQPIDDIRYTIDHPIALFVSATPDLNGREFTTQGTAWIDQQLAGAATKPAFLFVHGAQVGIFPEGGDKGTAQPEFSDLSKHENLVAIFSGDLHMDLHRIDGIVSHRGVDHVHIPAVERTKVPDESFHHPYFRLVTLYQDGLGVIELIDSETGQTLPKFTHRFDYKN